MSRFMWSVRNFIYGRAVAIEPDLEQHMRLMAARSYLEKNRKTAAGRATLASGERPQVVWVKARKRQCKK